jgi:hypothetical protein
VILKAVDWEARERESLASLALQFLGHEINFAAAAVTHIISNLWHREEEEEEKEIREMFNINQDVLFDSMCSWLLH